jgi:hypothetical protein
MAREMEIPNVNRLKKEVILVLTMMDIAIKQGQIIDVPKLQQELGIPVLPVNPRTKEGVEKLKNYISALTENRKAPEKTFYAPASEYADTVRKAQDIIPDLSEYAALHILTQKERFFEDESDFFCLLQVGIFRSNTIQIDELKVFLENLIVHVLGTENTKIVVEIDYKGEMLMDKLLDCEDFYDEMFVYTKHSEASSKLKPGVKLTVKNKEKYCYDLKVNARSYKIIPSEKNTIHELTNFGMNNSGSFTSQIGKDDIAMTLVDLNCVFENGNFQETVSDLYDIISEKFKKMIEERLSESAETQPNKNTEISNYTFLNGLLDS